MSHRLAAFVVLAAVLMSAAIICPGCGGGEADTSAEAESVPDQEESLPLGTLPGIDHEVIRDDIDDTPLKTQVERHVVVPGDLTPDELRSFLMAQRRAVLAMTGFEHHWGPTHVGIYAYDSPDKARSGAGQWVGMLLQLPSSSPKITLRGETPRTPTPPKRERFGLTEGERRTIYRQIIEAENRGTLEANRREPDDFDRNIALEKRLWEEYKNDLAASKGLTRAQLDSINQKGIQKQWPM